MHGTNLSVTDGTVVSVDTNIPGVHKTQTIAMINSYQTHTQKKYITNNNTIKEVSALVAKMHTKHVSTTQILCISMIAL